MTFNSLILIWFDKNKRNLPWRGETDPYKIWLSEIILQQTRVAQGTEYYHRFVQNFPTVNSLAKANEQEVLKLWQGLGYYSRARNLHFTAQLIVNKLNGNFPHSFTELVKLKGIGDYTAAAIASIAFHEPVSAIDGNAFRVYARYFNIHLDISIPKTRSYFFNLANEIIDQKNPGDFNQAIMELGATICLPSNPNCQNCPINDSCEALKEKTICQLPIKSKKIKIKKRYFHYLDVSDGENVLIKKRTGNDVWKNLYDFPLIELEESEKIENYTKYNLSNSEKIKEEVHILSHQRLHISFWKLDVDFLTLVNLAELWDSEIIANINLDKLPFPRPMEKYLEEIY